MTECSFVQVLTLVCIQLNKNLSALTEAPRTYDNGQFTMSRELFLVTTGA